MNPSEDFLLLKDAYQQISGFRTMQCAQSHENIIQIEQVEQGSNQLEHHDHPGWRLKIKGLCSKEIRDSTIGCSHSMVPVNYNRIINDLVKQEIIPESAVPLQEINDLIHKIYLMDHEKGKLEKQRAVFKNSQVPAQEIDEITSKLSDIRTEHVAMIKSLENLHQQVLQELGRRISEAQQEA